MGLGPERLAVESQAQCSLDEMRKFHLPRENNWGANEFDMARASKKFWSHRQPTQTNLHTLYTLPPDHIRALRLHLPAQFQNSKPLALESGEKKS